MKAERERERKYLIVHCTMGSEEEAVRIGREVVERRLAACVQIIAPIRSVYRWKGRVEESKEWLCLMKTTVGRFEALRETIRELHSYEVPEIVASEVEEGDREYLKWLEEEVCEE